ncbi:hypothetical protein M758_UG023300 [Ceratodon purpureus]|nr:hypothetical protein M758_UG023300 [Ceratodon purpureus]
MVQNPHQVFQTMQKQTTVAMCQRRMRQRNMTTSMWTKRRRKVLLNGIDLVTLINMERGKWECTQTLASILGAMGSWNSTGNVTKQKL